MTQLSNQHIEMNSTISCILLGAILIGITKFSDGHSTSEKCVSIASNTSGKMQCEPSKHIHIETISLDNEVCPSKPSKLITSIAILTCQGIRNCSVPFKTASTYDYLNIRYKCTGCQSAKHGMSVNITCQQNTGIKIEDAWVSWKTACPAYNVTHQHYQSLNKISRMCDLKQTCKLTYIGFRIMSIYFSCKAMTTTKRRSTTTTTTLYIKTKKLDLLHSKTTYSHSRFPSTVLSSNTTLPILMGNTLKDQAQVTFPAGAVVGGVIAGIIILFIPIGVLIYRRRNSSYTKSPQKQFVTRSNPAYESDMDVGTDGNPDKNKDSSLYHHYFEVQNDPGILTPTHNYINTDTMTYDYASGNGSFKDDTYDNMKQGISEKQQSEGIESNTYSHLHDTCYDSNDTMYDNATHQRVPDMSENEYSVSRGQMSNDDYDVSGNHCRGNHKNGSDNVYN